MCRSYGFDFVSFETLEETNAVIKLCQKNSDLLDYYTYVGGNEILI
jgi:hypothetical protein